MADDQNAETVARIPIFRWSGPYVGFLTEQFFFDAAGRYLGWYECDLRVWRSDGVPLGTVVDRHYIMRDRRATPPLRRTPRVPPVPPMLPRPPANRVARVPMPGWVDALEAVGRRPTVDELAGDWWLDESLLSLSADGRFVWRQRGEIETAGWWSYRGNLIMTPDHPAEAENVVYRVIEFTGDALTLRRVTFEENSLLFTVRRRAAAARAGGHQLQGPGV
jgi:hypothetical protein